MISYEEVDDGPFHSKIHKVDCCLPFLCLPCNTLFWPCRTLVSGNKIRFSEKGFDLDLAIVHERIITHGFPASGIEHIYRNPRSEVKRFLDTFYPGHYMVYNFCCEPGRRYNPGVFEGNVEYYSFKDHCVPTLRTMVEFANSAKYWLDQDPLNICSLHCKAGKGRAGIMTCVLLIRAGICRTAAAAIEHYNSTRVKDKNGLTMISQQKYVLFYELLWRQVGIETSRRSRQIRYCN